jgi:hypothetical protein
MNDTGNLGMIPVFDDQSMLTAAEIVFLFHFFSSR